MKNVAVRLVRRGAPDDMVAIVGDHEMAAGESGPVLFSAVLARMLPELEPHKIAYLAYRLHDKLGPRRGVPHLVDGDVTLFLCPA